MNCLSFPESNAIKTYRRKRIRNSFVVIQNTISDDTEQLSDGAYRTYAVLLQYDYIDRQTGEYKGYVTVSIETLMQKRKKSRSAIYSYLQELENRGLVKPLPGEGYRLYN